MIVACDVDGVVADLMPEWLAQYNFDYSDSLTPSDITDWSPHKFVKPECGYRIYDYLDDNHLYDKVIPVVGAVDGVKFIRSCGHRVVFVTSSPMQTAGRKLKFLLELGLVELKYGRVCSDYIECHDKSLIRADLLIDDKPENCSSFDRYSLLFDTPANRHIKASSLGLCWRLRGWENIGNRLTKIARKVAWDNDW